MFINTQLLRAGFSWWGARGPAIGIGDGERGLPSPPPPKKIPEIYFAGKHNVKFEHFVNFLNK